MIFRDKIISIIAFLTAGFTLCLNISGNLETKWLCILLLPFVLCAFHFLCSRRNIFMYPVYAASVLILTEFLLRNQRLLGAILAGAAMLLSMLSVIVLYVMNIKCFASLDYVAAFTTFHEEMKKNYALQGWKNTDFDDKYNTFLPLIQKAQINHDKLAYVLAFRTYLSSYQDGHVQLCDLFEMAGLGSTRNIQNANRKLISNYFGMFLMQLDSGEYVAVNVTKGGSADIAGIHDGTVITRWDKISIEEQTKKIDTLIPINCAVFADIENIERFKPFYISCSDAQQVDVTFIDVTGREQTATLDAMEKGYEHLYYTIGYVLHKKHKQDIAEKITYQTLPDQIGYLKITEMGSDYKAITKQMEHIAKQIKADQIRSLVIDVRNNRGGEDQAGAIIAGYFAKKNSCYLKETRYDKKTKQYILKKTINLEAKNRIDVSIMLLINSDCISAGEGFVYRMKQLGNVTVAGLTGTNGSFGSIKGGVIMPEGVLALYPCIACVDEAGSVMIDSDSKGLGGIKPDIVIPVDENAIKSIFDESCDYALEYVLQLLK